MPEEWILNNRVQHETTVASLATVVFVTLVLHLQVGCSEKVDSGAATDDSGDPALSDDCVWGMWRDPKSGYCWELNPDSERYTWEDAVDYCCNLNLGGHTDWRLPTIEELRTIVRECPDSETGGRCQVKDDGLRLPSNKYCYGCEENFGPSEGGCYWDPKLNGKCDFGYRSITLSAFPPMRSARHIEFDEANIGMYYNCRSCLEYVRCMRSENNLKPCDAEKQAITLPPAMAASVTVGNNRSCSLTEDGSVRCWGSGYLGDGGQMSIIPIEPYGLKKNIVKITASTDHSCVLTEEGRVFCWGTNWLGVLGQRTDNGELPGEVVGLGAGNKAISISYAHNCVVTSDGGVKCWGGSNNRGQLGNGTTNASSIPVSVKGLDCAATDVVVGGSFSCALCSTGKLKCWGQNSDGQLGNGTKEDSLSPVEVTGLNGEVEMLSAFSRHICALLKNGRGMCWGRNPRGCLGNGLTEDSTVPVEIVGIEDKLTSISTGNDYTCVTTAAGQVLCWGRNTSKQLGRSETEYDYESLKPLVVQGIQSGAASVACDEYHTCAVMSDGGIKCWGDNSGGGLGNIIGTEGCIEWGDCHVATPLDVNDFGPKFVK